MTSAEQRVKMLMGETMVNLQVAMARIEELEKALKDSQQQPHDATTLDERSGKVNGAE